jgi:MoaA/NifB/PqqE/SkfB family radical SAM enzyme
MPDAVVSAPGRSSLAAGPYPLIVVCRITTACNLSCSFCAFDRRLPFARTTLSRTQIERLIRLIADWQMRHGSGQGAHPGAPRPLPGVPLLSWLGGEPLAWRDWARFSALARSRGLAVSATSNGSTLASAQSRARVLEHLDELTVSVDAIGGTHDALRGWPGGYRRLLAALRALADARAPGVRTPRLRANIVLMRSTIDGFAALASELASAGVDEISFNLLGGRDRPDFHATEAVPSASLDRLLLQLPLLRRELAQIGVTLSGDDRYAARLRASSRGQRWPVGDCAPGAQFLFVDEHGKVAPCAFTGAEYGIALDAIDSLDELPARFAAARRARRARACDDCPSTQVFGKFGQAPGVVDSQPEAVVTDAWEYA